MKKVIWGGLISALLLSLLVSGISCTKTVYVIPQPTYTPPLETTPTSTRIPEPYPQSNLKLLGVYSDQECTQLVSMFDFGSIPSEYSGFITIPVYIKNLTGDKLRVGTDENDRAPIGQVHLYAAPPKFYSETDIEPGKTGDFHLYWITSTAHVPYEPKDYQFTVTVTGEWETRGTFSIVFPARLVLYQ